MACLKVASGRLLPTNPDIPELKTFGMSVRHTGLIEREMHIPVFTLCANLLRAISLQKATMTTGNEVGDLACGTVTVRRPAPLAGMAIIAAGPLTNLLVAFLVFAGPLAIQGRSATRPMTTNVVA